MGFACTFVLGRAGEPIRPVLIARKDSLPIPQMFGVYVLERVFDMAAAVVLAGLSLLFFERQGLSGGQGTTIIRIARSAGIALLLGLVAITAFLVYFRFHGGQWLARKLQHESWRRGWREKVAVLIEGFSDGLQGIRTVERSDGAAGADGDALGAGDGGVLYGSFHAVARRRSCSGA